MVNTENTMVSRVVLVWYAFAERVWLWLARFDVVHTWFLAHPVVVAGFLHD